MNPFDSRLSQLSNLLKISIEKVTTDSKRISVNITSKKAVKIKYKILQAQDTSPINTTVEYAVPRILIVTKIDESPLTHPTFTQNRSSVLMILSNSIGSG
jgi:hypothetical protein